MKKQVIYIGGAILIGAIGYYLYKKLKNSGGKSDSVGKSDSGGRKNDKDGDSSSPTLTDSQLETMAETLKNAFAGCTTDNDAVDNVFKKINSEADVNALIKKYGRRKYDACNWEFDFGDKEYPLGEALASEGNTDRVNKILANNNIKYKF